MKPILTITKPKNSTHIIWEHILKSVVAFVGTFALLFFGPLFLGGKSRSRQGDSELAEDMIDFIINHPEIQVGISLLAVLVYNAIIIWKNTQKKYLVGIVLKEKEAILSITNLYYKSTKELQFPIENLECQINSKTADSGEKDSTLLFIDNRTGRKIASILPKHMIWSEQIMDIRNALVELNSLGVKKSVSNRNYTSFLGSLFRE